MVTIGNYKVQINQQNCTYVRELSLQLIIWIQRTHNFKFSDNQNRMEIIGDPVHFMLSHYNIRYKKIFRNNLLMFVQSSLISEYFSIKSKYINRRSFVLLEYLAILFIMLQIFRQNLRFQRINSMFSCPIIEKCWLYSIKYEMLFLILQSINLISIIIQIYHMMRRNQNLSKAQSLQIYPFIPIKGFEEQIIYGITAYVGQITPINKVILYQIPEHYSFIGIIDSGYINLICLYSCMFTPNSNIKDNVYELKIVDNQEKYHLLFTSSQQLHRVYNGLASLQQQISRSKDKENFNSDAIKIFITFNTNSDLKLQQFEINLMINSLHLSTYQNYAIALLDEINEYRLKKEMGIISFKIYISLLQCDVQYFPLYCKYADKNINQAKNLVQKYLGKYLRKSQFTKFIQIQQKQKINNNVDNYWLSSKYESLSFYQFCSYLKSKQNSIVIRNKPLNSKDLTLPLTSYYVNSSHNTYLSGNQLTSDSAPQRYRFDLLQGLRCLQIDIHDDSEEPIVKHGFTLTSKITFQNVIKQINLFCQNNDKHTPIILSFENHCGTKNRVKMKQILQKYFGNKILKLNKQQGTTFPTLAELTNKIIIQGVLLNQYDPLQQYYSIVVANLDDEQIWKNTKNMANLSQNKVLSKISDQEQKKKLFQFSKTHWVRVYPSGSRVDSSNFNPIPMLMHGCQLTSFNTQLDQKYNTIMRCQFICSQGTGYLLKEDLLNNKSKKTRITLSFRSCHQMVPLKRDQHQENTCISVCFLGSDRDMKNNKNFVQLTKVSESFIKSSFSVTFSNPIQIVIEVQDLFFANIYVEVDGCGRAGIPLRLARNGLRSLTLHQYSKQNLKKNGKIIVESFID